jgi:hypothetical protein
VKWYRFTPGPRVELRAWGYAALILGIGVAAVEALSAADAGASGEGAADPLPALSVAWYLAPVAMAAGSAVAVARDRLSGDWDGWRSLGMRTSTVLIVAALGAFDLGLVAAFIPRPPSVLDLPAAVPSGARLWDSAWAQEEVRRVRPDWKPRRPLPEFYQPPLARLQQPPATEFLPGLLVWPRALPLPRARHGVYRAELVRRAGLVLLWPLGALAGAASALGRTRDRLARADPLAVPVSALLAALATALCLLGILCVSAYLASMTQ